MASKSKKSTQRKLTAILSADVVGYSRLMGADEEATVATLGAYRKVFTSKIKKHRGRVVDAKGDALLAEFAAVTDAVSCAVEIQGKLSERNADLPDDRRMDFRIGINLGEVMVKGEEIYGDGVNVAARLEALAEPGGICISRSAYDQVESKLNLECEYLGEQQVKNIAKPVRAYRVNFMQSEGGKRVQQPEPVSAASLMPDGFSLELPDRPSIAVLAFQNMSGDPEQEYFSDGITEDIITDLSRLPRLFVIARNSSFQFKGQHVDVRKIGEELGVKYVLEGSVRKVGDRVRVTAQLVEASSGEHLWAQRYDRELTDIFAIQDEITRDIAAELEIKLVEGEQARLWQRGTKNLEAYDLAMRGRDLYRRFTRADNARGRRLLEQAMELDSGFGYAITQLGWTYSNEASSGSTQFPEACFDRALELGKQALALDGSSVDAHTLLCGAYAFNGEHKLAVEHGERAEALNPDDADAKAIFSRVLVSVGRGINALERIKTALRLNPFPPAWYLNCLAVAYRSVGSFEEAIAVNHECIKQLPDMHAAHLGLTLAYMEAGREEEGQAQARNVLRITPDFSSSSNAWVQSHEDPATRERQIALLRKAGLPE